MFRWISRWFRPQGRDFHRLFEVQGDGQTRATAFKLVPYNRVTLRARLLEALEGATVPDLSAKPEENEEVLDGMVAEMMKDMFLKEHLEMGDEEGVPGERTYLADSSIQVTEVNRPDGTRYPVYFDFSAFGCWFDGNETTAPSPVAPVETTAPGVGGAEEGVLRVHGLKRTVRIERMALSVLVTLARQEGWSGPDDWFEDGTGDGFSLSRLKNGASLTDEEARGLADSLHAAMQEDAPPEMAFIHEFILACSEGAIVIQESGKAHAGVTDAGIRKGTKLEQACWTMAEAVVRKANAGDVFTCLLYVLAGQGDEFTVLQMDSVPEAIDAAHEALKTTYRGADGYVIAYDGGWKDDSGEHEAVMLEAEAAPEREPSGARR
ncbi:MAG: hypothetical protein QM755_16270 [Luteolibacter sp.]